MSDENREKYLDIINTIGAAKVDELYNKLGTERISMATLKKIIAQNYIDGALRAKRSVANVAADRGVSRLTVYRVIHKK
ncbi:MAG: hypothetical protein ABI723_15475 [Bacteroidia bacterium]